MLVECVDPRHCLQPLVITTTDHRYQGEDTSLGRSVTRDTNYTVTSSELALPDVY